MYVRDVVTSIVFNWDDVSYKTNAQFIDFVASQFTFELLGLMLYPLFQLCLLEAVFMRISSTYKDIIDHPNLSLN